MSFSKTEIAEMQSIFFEASLIGYSSQNSNKRIERLFGNAKSIRFHRGGFSVVDRYFVGADDYSSGSMIMVRKSTPVWSISYFGMYRKEAIPVLKMALRSNYESKVFVGGRGPKEFEDGTSEQIYRNFPAPAAGDFGYFYGEEIIRSSDNRYILGWHRYQGGLLG